MIANIIEWCGLRSGKVYLTEYGVNYKEWVIYQTEQLINARNGWVNRMSNITNGDTKQSAGVTSLLFQIIAIYLIFSKSFFHYPFLTFKNEKISKNYFYECPFVRNDIYSLPYTIFFKITNLNLSSTCR